MKCYISYSNLHEKHFKTRRWHLCLLWICNFHLNKFCYNFLHLSNFSLQHLVTLQLPGCLPAWSFRAWKLSHSFIIPQKLSSSPKPVKLCYTLSCIGGSWGTAELACSLKVNTRGFINRQCVNTVACRSRPTQDCRVKQKKEVQIK